MACGIAAVELRHGHSTQRVLKKMRQAVAMSRCLLISSGAKALPCVDAAHSVFVQIICSSHGCPHTEAATVFFELVYVEKEIQQVFS